MTVAELIKQLQELPQDHEVILSKDAEGNNFSPLYQMGEGCYHPETTWYGEVDFELEENFPNAVVIFPVN